MIQNFEKLVNYLEDRARFFTGDCQKLFVAASGGIDSSVIIGLLCKFFGPENVVGLYRNIRSNPKHLEDVNLLQKTFGFKSICIDGNFLYDNFLAQTKSEFEKAGLPWADEGTLEASEQGFTNAYASLKSRFTTPMAGFISKAIDQGRGRIFGTGNGEEDGLLRYFDKFGDGAVDNNLLSGLTKAEVRQLARHLGVPEKIIIKVPSADLEACGDGHNDECQLTDWARSMGYDVNISYGASDGSKEGNIAWAWKEDIKNGVITGKNSNLSAEDLKKVMKYKEEEAKVVLFLREVERKTRHKVESIPGVGREELMERGLVD